MLPHESIFSRTFVLIQPRTSSLKLKFGKFDESIRAKACSRLGAPPSKKRAQAIPDPPAPVVLAPQGAAVAASPRSPADGVAKGRRLCLF